MPDGHEEEEAVWGMFSTHSSVAQLKPDTISQCVQEAEERQWSQGDLARLSQGSHDADREMLDLGSMLLSQNTSLKKIHSYFSQLESRKCCLHLACRRSTFNSMRVVPTSRTVDDGSAKTNQPTTEITYLDNKELRVFKHAYLCAVYPVLAAPDPPSPLSPSPVMQDTDTSSNMAGQHRRGSYAPNGEHESFISPSTSAVPNLSSSCPVPTRPITPYSLHDSGVEESDEAGLIPMESVCEQLQRAFRLSRTVFRQYEGLITRTYAKKSCQRLLAEELSGQLAVLETNTHPFYSPKHFITQNGYDLWQKQKRTHISELLNKFWQYSLPFPRDNQDLIAELHSVHEDYHILLKKLLHYENQFRETSEVSSGATFTPLSSASCRLLLEFGLRYGIGELYRKTLLLQCLISEFSPSVGYLTYIHGLVVGLQQMLPSNKSAVIMVKQEFDILHSSLRVLKVQTCKAISQMKTLFPGNRPVEGIELLLALLHSVLRLMGYLAPANTTREKLHICLTNTVQSIFKPTYDLFKSVAMDDLNQGRQAGLDPRLLNVLIQDIREDVADYKSNFESTFAKFFSISEMAAKAFYQLLMEDVETLCQSDLKHKPLVEIDLRMLALAYRLNTLDSDWAMYIAPQQQAWRVSFLSSLTQWTTALRSHLQNLVLDTVAGDAYVSQNLDLPQPVLTYQPSSTPTDHRSVSFSIMSISPSVNSAFSSIVSSISSTPHQESIPETTEELDTLTEEHTGIEDFGLTEYEMRPGANKSKSEHDTKSLRLKPMSPRLRNFTAFRRFSLPGRLSESKSREQFTINQLSKESGVHNDATLHRASQYQSKTTTGHHQATSSIRNGTQSMGDMTKCHTAGQSQVSTSGSLDYCPQVNSPFPPLTPDSIDNDSLGHIVCESRNDVESDNEDFKYPPLKIVSQRPVSHDMPSDFTKPVFSKLSSFESIRRQSSEESNTRHLLRTDAPQSASSRASSITPNFDNDTRRYDFMDSLESNVSFPHPPDTTQAVMPVSGSAVDVLVMLQRLCGFSTSLVTMLLVDNPFLTASCGESSHSAEPRPSSGSVINESPLPTLERSALSSSTSSVDAKCPFPIYDRPHSPPSQSRSQNSSRNKQRRPSEANSEAAVASTTTQGRNGLLGTITPTPSETGSSASSIPAYDGHKIRLCLHLRFHKAMCNMFIVYSTNMLCMDLCSTPRYMAKRLIGPQLVEFVESQQLGGLIWGCRHQAEVSHDCLYYYKRNTKFLCDRYEPVTRHMCTRINNVFACLHFLEKYEKNLLKAFNIDSENDSQEGSSVHSGDEEDFDRVSSCSEEYVRVSHNATHDLNMGDDSVSTTFSDHNSHIHRRWVNQTSQATDIARKHLMAVLTGMCRLLAHKLSLFVRDGLYLLLHLKHNTISITTCLAPITSFLQKYLDCLSTWLYRECFRRVLDNLWVLIVQDVEFHVEKLKKSGTSASTEAHNWMLAISHLIKFMNNNGKGIKKDLLLAQANDVIFRLQLYTLSTWHLIALYQNLKEYYTEGDHLTLEENAMRSPPAIIHRIHSELQSLRKCFSGAELVHWIMKKREALPADLLLPSDTVTKESALTICQILLDQQFIVEVDSECYTRSTTPHSENLLDGFSPYPQLSVHSHAASDHSRSWSHRNRDNSDSSDSTVESVRVTHAAVHRDYDSGDHVSPNVTPTPENDDSSPATPTPSATPSPNTTPTPRGNRTLSPHNVGSESDVDQEIASYHETSIGHRGNDFIYKSTQPQSQIHQSATVSDFRGSNFQDVYATRQTHADSLSDDGYFFDHEKRHTPFSSLAEAAFHVGNRFKASTRKFYLIHQSVLHPGVGGGPHGSSSLDSSLSEQQKKFHKVKTSRESLALVEQCFTHKISPSTIIAIIAGRKKNDSLAKNFVKLLPAKVSDQLHDLLDDPIIECKSS